MIAGTVTPDREAIIRLAIYHTNRKAHELDVVVDTGSNGWLTLSPSFIAALGLHWQRFGRAILADRSEIVFNIYEATIDWDGKGRKQKTVRQPAK